MNACDLCGKEIPVAPKFPEATTCKECLAQVDADIKREAPADPFKTIKHPAPPITEGDLP